MVSKIVAVLAVMMLLAAPARADVATPTVDWPVPPSGVMTRSLDVAYHYWWVHGVTPAPRAQLVIRLADLPDADGTITAAEALLGGTRIWIDAAFFTDLNRRMPHSLDLQQIGRQLLCGVVVHEVGHTAGLDHGAPFDVMKDDGGVYSPWQCRKAFPMPPLRD